LKYFLRAIELFPNDSHAYNNLGNLYLYEDPLKAVKYFKKGI
jgi:Flp pilus assembly protein TadD